MSYISAEHWFSSIDYLFQCINWLISACNIFPVVWWGTFCRNLLLQFQLLWLHSSEWAIFLSCIGEFPAWLSMSEDSKKHFAQMLSQFHFSSGKPFHQRNSHTAYVIGRTSKTTCSSQLKTSNAFMQNNTFPNLLGSIWHWEGSILRGVVLGTSNEHSPALTTLIWRTAWPCASGDCMDDSDDAGGTLSQNAFSLVPTDPRAAICPYSTMKSSRRMAKWRN